MSVRSALPVLEKLVAKDMTVSVRGKAKRPAGEGQLVRGLPRSHRPFVIP